jgi:hypothetical protein
MHQVILLNHNENTRLVELEERERFVRNLLETMELPLDGIWGDDNSLTVESKIKLRGILSAYKIEVIDNLAGEVKIYHEDQLVGEWKRCFYKLKKDAGQKDPRKRLYLELHTEFNTIFDQINE